MIEPEKQPKAIRAIQGLLIVGRALAQKGEPHERLIALMDHGEYLPGLILETADRTSAFEAYLQGMVGEFPEVQWILDEFRT